MSGLAKWSKKILNIGWILAFLGNWSLRMAGPGFIIIVKGSIFLWSSFLLGRVVRRFCINRYTLSPTFRLSIL